MFDKIYSNGCSFMWGHHHNNPWYFKYFEETKDIDISKFLEDSGNDVVISLVSPYKHLRDEFKSQCKVQEIYCHTKKIRGREDKFALDYQPPTEYFIDLDTSDTSDETFKKLVKMIL
jgi:hypothetical protein